MSILSIPKLTLSTSVPRLIFAAKRSKSIKAAILKELKAPLVIGNIQRKSLSKNQIRIKVQYCSVNQSDQQIIQAQHEHKPDLPFVPGYEIAGQVIETSSEASAKGFSKGDQVIGLNKEGCGGFAEECLLNVNDCFHAPQGISAKESSAILDGYTTAVLGVARRGRIKEGDTVMITAAAGGVGLAAVDLAANVYRAKVIAVCSTEDKAALVREKGAFAALKYTKDLPNEIKKITKGKGVDLVFDAVGGDVFLNALKCVSMEGRIVQASNAARDTQPISPSLILPNSISLVGVSLWHYRQFSLQTYRDTIEDVIDMAEQELIAPAISKEFPLHKVNDALEYLNDAKCTGKVVLCIEYNDDD